MTKTDAEKQKPLQGVVVPVDNRTSVERVQDTCFEGLLQTYTKDRDWDMVTRIGALYERILNDRATDRDVLPTPNDITVEDEDTP